MPAAAEHAKLLDLVHWIDQHIAGLVLPCDERSQLAIGCLDVALEHQAAIALLYYSELYGSMHAMLRVLSDAVVRGVWLHQCATEADLARFKNGHIPPFGELVRQYEEKLGTPDGVLSGFKMSAWASLCDFTHTGFLQVIRRHSPGRLGANYPDRELAAVLGAAGALGLLAACTLVAIARRDDLGPSLAEKVTAFVRPEPWD